MRELHIDYSIDSPVYLGRQTLLQGFRHVYSSQECQIKSQRYFPHPTRGGDSTDQTSQPNLHTYIFLTLSIHQHTIKCYYSTLTMFPPSLDSARENSQPCFSHVKLTNIRVSNYIVCQSINTRVRVRERVRVGVRAKLRVALMRTIVLQSVLYIHATQSTFQINVVSISILTYEVRG